MDNNIPHTRAATRAGIYPAPKPLYSPLALSFGSVGAGAQDVPSIDSSMMPAAVPAARPTPAQTAGVSVTSVASQPSTVGAGGFSSEMPLLTPSKEDTGVPGDAPALVEDDDGGWTPVTHKTSRTHRENSMSNRGKYTNDCPCDP